jgi:thymidylate kinase
MIPLLIFEGVDNLGKDTLIKNILQHSSNYIVRHFSNPKGKTTVEQIQYQKDDFLYEFRKQTLRKQFKKTDSDVFIWNRSHIGEWVYGQIYRNYKPNWIFELEKLFSFDKDQTVFLILLDAPPDFSLKNDDGLSFTTSKEKRENERSKFKEAFEKSLIQNKIQISVVDKTNKQFKKEEDIYEELFKFIKSKTNK